MGFLNKFKGKKEMIDWSHAYEVNPHFYKKPDGSVFGAIALTEGTETILLKNHRRNIVLMERKSMSGN